MENKVGVDEGGRGNTQGDEVGEEVEVTLRRGGKSLTGATCKCAAFVPFDFAPLLCDFLAIHNVNDFCPLMP